MSPKNYTPIHDLIRKHQRELAQARMAKGRPKEAEPFVSKKEKYEIKEVIEHKVEDEVKPYVEARAETIELPDDLKKMGLHAASKTEFPNYQNIKLPLSDEKIIAGLHQPVTSSVRWLATLAEYLLAQAHLALKVINGKIIRVVKT